MQQQKIWLQIHTIMKQFIRICFYRNKFSVDKESESLSCSNNWEKQNFVHEDTFFA